MEIRQLRYFVEVVEAGSFTRAAERVRVAQPALGFQVRKLEDELGVALLVRHSRGIEPTEAGRALLRHANSVLRQIELARQELIDRAGPPRGPVVLGITATASALLATRLVRTVSESYPDIALNLVEGMSEEVMRWLGDNRIDLGLTYNPEAAPAIRCEKLLVEDLYFIGRAGAEGAGERPQRFTRLAAFPLLLPSRPHGTRLLIEEAARKEGIALRVIYEIDSVATIRELVESGTGYTVLPYAAVQDAVRLGSLFARRVERPRLSRTLHLAFAANYLGSNAAEAVRGAVVELAAERAGTSGGFWRPPPGAAAT